MRKPKGMFCFSPEVMLGTFVIEIFLALYTLVRYKMNLIGKLAALSLVCLAVFQAAEYNVCAASWIDPMLASRIGYVAITLLPPLGIHLIYAIAKVKNRLVVVSAYAIAAAFSVFFLTVGSSLSGHVCQGNYVIFDVAPGSAWLYGLYYYGLLFVGVALCLLLANKVKGRTRQALRWYAIGYLAFMLPTTTANIIDPNTVAGIPSIMCGFAILFALILSVRVMPFVGTKR